MFKKNLMEFFIRLNYYLYYFTVAVLLLAYDHMSFQNVLQSPDLVMWSDYLSFYAIYILTPLYDLRFLDWVYHKWPLTDLWLLDLIIKVFKKAKLDKQQKMLLSLRFILRHIVLKYMIVVVCAPEQPTIWSLPIVLHIGVLLFLK